VKNFKADIIKQKKDEIELPDIFFGILWGLSPLGLALVFAFILGELKLPNKVFLMSPETIKQLVSLAPWVLAIVAIAGLLYQIKLNNSKWARDESKFCLSSALEAFEEAYKLLADGNNNRVTWISAARALKRGQNMTSGITQQVHKDVLEVQLDRYRNLFAQILGADNPHKRKEFFAGDPKVPMELDNIWPILPGAKDIPPTTLKVIWDFAQFPPGYEDPIDFDESFSDDEIDRGVNRVIWRGLFEYLKEKRKPKD
jgi:hypothetical protein